MWNDLNYTHPYSHMLKKKNKKEIHQNAFIGQGSPENFPPGLTFKPNLESLSQSYLIISWGALNTVIAKPSLAPSK